MKKANPATKTTVYSGLRSKKNSQIRSFKCENEKQNIFSVKSKEKHETPVKKLGRVHFVRNSEQSIRTANSVVQFAPVSRNQATSLLIDSISETGNSIESENNCGNTRLDIPELCTSLKIAENLIKDVTADDKHNHDKINHETYCSSKNLTAKVVRKVNIPFEENVYKELVELKVTEDDFYISQGSKLKSKNFYRTWEKKPELPMFYIPSFVQEYLLKVEKFKIDSENMACYDGSSLLDRIRIF